MRLLFLVSTFICLSCVSRDTVLAEGIGQGAFMEGNDLFLFGADGEGRDIDGNDFACPVQTGSPCRRVFVARYDKKFLRTAQYAEDHGVKETQVLVRRRAAGGYHLLTVGVSWGVDTGEGSTTPLFDVTLTALTDALEKIDSFTIVSQGEVAIHAAALDGAGLLLTAGTEADALFVERYDPDTGASRGRTTYPDQTGGGVVFLGGVNGMTHLLRHFPDEGYRYLVIDDQDDTVAAALTIQGDVDLDPFPVAGAHGIAAQLTAAGTLYWLGVDDGLYRFVRSGDSLSIETAAVLEIGELSYQRDLRFLDGATYVLGANDRASHIEACSYAGDIATTHETELVLEKFDANYRRLWEDRETEGAAYRAIEILARGEERLFVFQKGDRVLIRPTE